jgi:hypothetical protein
MNATAMSVGAAHSGLRSLKKQKLEEQALKEQRLPDLNGYLQMIEAESIRINNYWS